jgi:cytochrome bd-type quinol oxidase subunit 2
MSIDEQATQAANYSADGHWWWDGQQWTPVAGARPADAPETREAGRPAQSLVRGLGLALGIMAIVVGVVLWVYAGSVTASRTNDLIVTGLLTLGFIPGLLAVIFGLAPRSRSRTSTAAFTCGLVGFGLTFLWVAFTILNF